MVPDRVVVVEQWPLSANGKVDRPQIAAALEAALAAAPVAAAAPRAGVEAQLAALWAALLARPAIGRDDNFFALGGDSLLATRLVDQVRERLGLDLPLNGCSPPTRWPMSPPEFQQAGSDVGVIE